MKKRLLGWILTVCMAVSIFPVSALAEENLPSVENEPVAMSTGDANDAIVPEDTKTPAEDNGNGIIPGNAETPNAGDTDGIVPESPGTAAAAEEFETTNAKAADNAIAMEILEATAEGTETPEEGQSSGVTDADSFNTAIAAGGTVMLGNDITLADDTTFSVKTDVVLDLNGHTLSISTASKSLFTIGAASFTLTDTSTGQNGKISVEKCSAKLINVNDANASFTMAGGAIEATNLSADSASLVYVNNGSFTINGGTITATVGNAAARPVQVVNANAVFSMTGGTIEAKAVGNYQLTALYINGCASASFTGGTVRSENNGTGACYNLWLREKAQDITLDGVTVEAIGTSTGDITALYINHNANVTAIKGSTTITAKLTTETTGTVNALWLNSGDAKIESIEGGLKASADIAGTGAARALYTAAGTIGSISGGTYTATSAGDSNYACGIRLNTANSYIGTLKNATITATSNTGCGIYIDGPVSVGTIENCTITGSRAGIYMTCDTSKTTGATIDEIKSCTVTATNTKKENAYGYALYLNGFSTVNKVTGGTFTGANSYIDTNGNASANGYAVYANGTKTKIGSFGGTCVVKEQYNGAPFTGKNYGLRNKGTVNIADDADITGDNLYAAVWNYNAGKLTISGGAIGSASCTYGVFNDQYDADNVPELTISGGMITGEIGIYNEGRIVELSGGSITGTTYGLQNIIPASAAVAEIGTLSGGTITGGQFGVYNEGAVAILSGGSYGGSIAGIFVGNGTVSTITGNKSITITNGTPWGVVYSGTLSTMPEDFNNDGDKTISGAGEYPTDQDANYKDYGVQPTIVNGNYFYGNGLDITIDARTVNGEVQESGCVITWTNQVLGQQSVDTGAANWYIFAGSYGRKEGIAADNTDDPLITLPYEYNKTKDTITVTVNGGKIAAISGGGNGNTLVRGTVQMDINGGSMTSLRGGGTFSLYSWGNAGWGKGWSIVENVVININGPCTITYSFEVAGQNAWVNNATVNLYSDFTLKQDEINVAGQAEYLESSKMGQAAAQALAIDGRSGTQLTITEQAELVKKLCLTYEDNEPKRDGNGYLVPNPEGFGSVVVNAVVNCCANVNKSVHGGNYGGSVVSYVDNLVVNVEEGYKLGNISIANTYGHVENTTINLKGTTNYIEGGRAGSAKNITVNVGENGNAVNSICVGHMWGGLSNSANGTGGTVSGNAGGLVEGSKIRIDNQNQDKTLNVNISGGVESLDYICTGNVLLRGGNSYALWNFIRPGANYKTTDFTWSRENHEDEHYGQKGYLLVTGDLINIVDSSQDTSYSVNNSNFVLGDTTGSEYTNTSSGNGKLYIYQGQVTSEEQLPAALQSGDGVTVVFGSLLDRPADAAEGFTPGGRINGVAVSEYMNVPVPGAVVLEANGSRTLLDNGGQKLAVPSEWTLKFAGADAEGKFEADPDKYVALDGLTIQDGDTLYYTATRQGVTIFSVAKLTVATVNNTRTITYDLNGSDMTGFTQSQSVAGSAGTVISDEPTWNGNYVFAYWNTKQDGSGVTYLPGSNITLTEDITLYAQWIRTGDVTVTVVDLDGNPASGAKVKLMQGANAIGTETTTDSEGTATFSNIPYGSYNVVAVSEDGKSNTVTTTVGTDLHTDHIAVMVAVPVIRLNTVVEGKVPAAAVGLANAISDQEKAYLADSGNSTVEITVTLTVKETEDENIPTAISEAAGADRILTDYLDVTVTRTVITVGSDGTETKGDTETIPTTADYQTITFSISNALYNALASVNGTPQNNIIVYRLHVAADGTDTIEQLRKASESRGKNANYDCYYIREIEGMPYITVRSKNFSTYAFGVQKEPVSEYAPSGNNNGNAAARTITVDASDHGTVKPSRANASSGTEIVLIVTPDEGYALDAITVTTTDGVNVTLTDNDDGTYTFIMPASKVTVTALFEPAGSTVADCPRDGTCPITAFDDAYPTAWYHNGIHYCVEEKLMIGTAAATFAPNVPAKRAMIAMTLWRLAGSPKADYALRYDDVYEGTWYTEAIRWAASVGVVEGHGNGKFGPNDPITREQLAAMLYRYAQIYGDGFTGSRTSLLDFKDREEVSEWAYEAMCCMTMNGIIEGKDNGVLDPKGQATRAETATMMYRYRLMGIYQQPLIEKQE